MISHHHGIVRECQGVPYIDLVFISYCVSNDYLQQFTGKDDNRRRAISNLIILNFGNVCTQNKHVPVTKGGFVSYVMRDMRLFTLELQRKLFCEKIRLLQKDLPVHLTTRHLT